jgi:hypothetical protein
MSFPNPIKMNFRHPSYQNPRMEIDFSPSFRLFLVIHTLEPWIMKPWSGRGRSISTFKECFWSAREELKKKKKWCFYLRNCSVQPLHNSVFRVWGTEVTLYSVFPYAGLKYRVQRKKVSWEVALSTAFSFLQNCKGGVSMVSSLLSTPSHRITNLSGLCSQDTQIVPRDFPCLFSILEPLIPVLISPHMTPMSQLNL